jgi:hypothetical protein
MTLKHIALLNPTKRRKKKAATKKTKRKPAKKRKTKRTTTRTTRTVKVTRNPARRTTVAKKRKTKRRAVRKNPTRRRKIARRASGAFGGLNLRSALKNIPLNTLGMFAAKWAAKRFGEAATETDPSTWNYASYLKGALGAASAGFIMNMIKRGTGQRILEGGMSLMLYKLVQNELIAGTSFWAGQLGEGESNYSPGDMETDSAGNAYILGQDYEWQPLDGVDDYRMEPGMYGGYGGQLVTPGPLGDALVTPGPLGATSDVDEMMKSSLLRR